jgi:hypothetical protein
MEEGYYQPKLEDLYVGYECEEGSYIPGTGGQLGNWQPKVHEAFMTNDDYVAMDADVQRLRTRYLTQKQIEDEGFELYVKSIDLWFKFKESPVMETDIQEFYGYKPYQLFLNYGAHDHKIKITCDFSGGCDFGSSDTLFEGFCPSINELRKIFKLLHIKKYEATKAAKASDGETTGEK